MRVMILSFSDIILMIAIFICDERVLIRYFLYILVRYKGLLTQHKSLRLSAHMNEESDVTA